MRERVRVGADDPQAADVEIGQGLGQVFDRNEEEMLHRARRSLDRRRGQRGLAVRRVDDSVHAGRLRGSQQGTEILGILERIENQHERRLLPLDRTRQDVVQAGELPAIGDQGDPLMTVEAGQRGERPAFDLDDRDPQVRGVQNQLLEGLAPLRNDQKPMRLAAGDERLLDGVPAGDQFLVFSEQIAG